MLRTENICYRIGKKAILKNISIDFMPGEFNMILGPNGSGKSTFLKIFSGELKPEKGNVLIDGKIINSIKKEDFAKVRAVMTQQPELGFPLSVEEVVMMGRYPHFVFNPSNKDKAICAEAIDKMRIQYLTGRNYLTLSGGEKQRVQFARVLAQIWELPVTGNRYLFLDEPLTNLDINYQQAFLIVAKELVKMNTVLVAIIHDINLSIQYADKLFFIKEGEIVASGKPLEVLSPDLIKHVFDVDARIIHNPLSGSPLVVYA